MSKRLFVYAAAVAGALTLVPSAAARPSFYAGPLFGLATAPTGALLVADSGQGVVRVRGARARVIAQLPGIADVAVRTRRTLWGLANNRLYRIAGGQARIVANLQRFERRRNPHPATTESNAFDVEGLPGRRAVVADAAGNDVLVVNRRGHVRLLAVLPDQLVPTANAKRLAGCPTPPDPELAFLCDLPARIPAEPVATSVAVGPDGAFYIGELKGFPSPRGKSRVWRVERGARGVHCGASPKCKLVVDGLTSIIDMKFRHGRLHVAQIDDASWFAMELGQGVGGSVRACNVHSGRCRVVVSGVPMLTAITFGRRGGLWGTVFSLVPGQADVVRLRQAFGPVQVPAQSLHLRLGAATR